MNDLIIFWVIMAITIVIFVGLLFVVTFVILDKIDHDNKNDFPKGVL